MPFDGIPTQAMTFFARLAADNSKAFWDAHKVTYEREVRQPFLALLASLPTVLREWRVYRPQRDTRFAKDKSPYKTFIGAVGHRFRGTAYSVQLDHQGLLAAAGAPIMASDQVARFRAAVADDRSGPELERVLAGLRDKGRVIKPGYNRPLKTAPRGYAADHPRIERLRWKGVECSERFHGAGWSDTPAVAESIRAFWEAAEPLNRWLDTHVGPSETPPEEMRGRRTRSDGLPSARTTR